MVHRTLMERFKAKVDRNGPTMYPELGPCAMWTAAKSPRGYGQFDDTTRMWRAHIWIWVHTYGPIPPETPIVRHRCDNPSCVRVDHLVLGTTRDNVADKIARGRGSTNGNERKTHCPSGHEYTPDNVYLYRGSRYCRACHYIYSLNYRRRKGAKPRR